jgi:flavin-dependent dehydrogenase
MELFDVAIVGGGPAGSSCAAFCAAAGLRTIVIEREKFPREKVCGDCLNPACWPVLRRLELVDRVRALPHARLERVEFAAISRRKITVDLPAGDEGEISIKRSLLDNLLLNRARELGAEVREESVVTALSKTAGGADWKIDIVREVFGAHVLVGADGRNSTVARLCNLLPRPERERVALQAHIALPEDFGNRVVLQLLPEGYSGQAPVNQNELNLCLVGTPPTIARLRHWAEQHFGLAADQAWHTITPLTRAPISAAHEKLFFIGDAARVVEPFTGEGIFYALRSGELASGAIVKIAHGEDRHLAVAQFVRAHAALYRGRLWINELARAAVLSPKLTSKLMRFAPLSGLLMRGLTGRVARA